MVDMLRNINERDSNKENVNFRRTDITVLFYMKKYL